MWPFGSKKETKVDEGADKVKGPAVVESMSAGDAAEKLFKDEPSDESKNREPGNAFGLDAAALERAAAAAKELQGLKYAGEAIEIAKLKEDRRAKQALAEMEENKARQKAIEVEKTRALEQERRQTLQQDHKLKQEQAYYSDQLSRKRHQDQLAAQRQMQEQQIKREEEFQLRVESMKRQTAEYEAKLRKDVERARVQAEMEGKADQERKNWDLRMQRSQMEAREFRTTVLQGVKEAGTMIGNGINGYLEDKQKLATTVGLFTAIAVGLYGAKVSTKVAGRIVESRLGKPPLVRETSRFSPLTNPVKSIRSLMTSGGDALSGVFVEEKLRTRLSTLAVSTSNTKKNKAPYRHTMLYGPPGTGKTLFAKKLAASSGMDFAIMTGGDIAPLGREAVTEIHKLFDWAGTSRKGLLVFVDEADAFLRKRSNEGMSEDQRNALNAFLYRTGTESSNFMLVYATNEPDQLDWAINDRTDELIKFSLPGLTERKQMVRHYFNKYVVNAHENTGGMFSGPEKIKIEGVEDAMLDKIAERTEGYSGREIAKLAIGWQAAAYGSSNCTLTSSLFDTVFDNSLEQHVQKLEWDSERK